MSGIGRRLYAANLGRLNSAMDEDIPELLRQAAADVEGHRFGAHFLWTEWSTGVDAWQLASWEDYRDVQRLGRKTRLSEKQRELLLIRSIGAAIGGRVEWPHVSVRGDLAPRNLDGVYHRHGAGDCGFRGQTDHRFRRKPITDSDSNRSPIPVETDHLQSGLRTRDNPAGVGSSLLLQEGRSWRTGGCPCGRFERCCGCTSPRR